MVYAVAGAAMVAAHQAPVRASLLNLARISVDLNDSYSISVTPNSALRDRDWVNVTYSSSSPSSDDLIILYSPLPTNFSAQAPIEWMSATADPSYLTSGKGTLQLQLLNMRDFYSIVLASGKETNPTVRSISAPVTFANYNEPRGARLAGSGRRTEMRVSWMSASASFGPVLTLMGGAGGNTSLPATSITWSASDLCGAPANTVGYRSLGFVHTVVATGLVPGMTYSYVVGDSTGSLGPFSFKQPPEGNSPAAFPFVFTAVGDMGQLPLDHSNEIYPFVPAPNTTLYIARSIREQGSNLHMHIGDLSYARGYAAEWDMFWNLVSSENLIAPVVPYMVGVARTATGR